MNSRTFYSCKVAYNGITTRVMIPALSVDEAQARLLAYSQGRVNRERTPKGPVPVFECSCPYGEEQVGIGLAAQTPQDADAYLQALTDAKIIIEHRLPFTLEVPEYATCGEIEGIIRDICDCGHPVRLRMVSSVSDPCVK